MIKAAKARTHWIAVKVTFDRAVTKTQAVRSANECFRNENQYVVDWMYCSNGVVGPSEMWLRQFKAVLPPPLTQKGELDGR